MKPEQKPAKTAKAAKKPNKRQTYRDAPAVPTAKQIEQSISKGKTVPLDEFVKGIKL